MGANRILKIAFLLIILPLGVAGCDLMPTTPEAALPTEEPEITPTPRPTAAYPPGVTPLVFWEPFALDRSQGMLLGEMIRDFEAGNPDIVVEIVPKNSYAGIHGAMLDGISRGEPVEPANDELPDLSVAFPSMITEYAAADVVAPLDAYLNDPEVGFTEEDLADIYPGYLEAGRLPGYGRQILAFPFVQNAIGMWVNETLLSQAGWDHPPVTWQEFEQACFDVMATTDMGCYPYIESVTTFDAWLYSRGGQPLNGSGRKATFNSPEGVESLALVQRLEGAGLAWRPDSPYGDYVAFANGQAAFTFSSTGNSPLYVDAYEGALLHEVPPFRWRQTMIPQIDPANPSTVLYGASFFVLKGEPENQLAAWRFVRWFTDRDQTARWSSELETLPVRASALDVMTDTLEAYPFFQAQVTQILPYGRPEPAIAAEFEVRDILYSAILSATQNYADPQIVLDQAAQEANRLLSNQP